MTDTRSTKEKLVLVCVRVAVAVLAWIVLILLYKVGIVSAIYDLVFDGSGDPSGGRKTVSYIMLSVGVVACIVAVILLMSKKMKSVLISGAVFAAGILPFLSLVAFEAAK